jgi:hypothetical protein
VLNEARQLGAELGLGGAAADPLAAAETALHHLGGRLEAAPPPDEPDPDAAQPYEVQPDRLAAQLSAHLPEVAQNLGPVGVGHAAAVLGSMPRELVTLLDDEGVFGSTQSWGLLAAIGANASSARGADPVHLDLNEISTHASRHGLPNDLETVSNVAVLVKALPPRLRAGISERMATDPDVWALAATMGGRLWGHVATRPRRT